MDEIFSEREYIVFQSIDLSSLVFLSLSLDVELSEMVPKQEGIGLELGLTRAIQSE